MKYPKILGLVLSVCLLVNGFSQATLANDQKLETSSQVKDQEDVDMASQVDSVQDHQGEADGALGPEVLNEDIDFLPGMIPVAATPPAIGLQKTAWSKWKAVAGKENFTNYNPQVDGEILRYRKAAFGDIQVINTESPLLQDGELEFIFKISDGTNTDVGRFGFIYRATDSGHGKVVFGDNQSGGRWSIESANDWKDVKGTILAPGQWHKVKVRYEANKVKVYANDVLVIDEDATGISGYPSGQGGIGFRDHYTPKEVEIMSIKNGELDSIPSLDMAEYSKVLHEAKIKVENPAYTQASRDQLKAVLDPLPNFYQDQSEIEEVIKLVRQAISHLQSPQPVQTVTLENQSMKVTLSQEFPQVISYEMKNLANQVMNGQKQPLNTIRINDIDLVPQVTGTQVSGEKMDYHLKVQDGDINAELKVEITLDNDVLTWAITEISNLNTDKTEDKIIRTIEVPNLSLVSINSNQNNPTLHGGKVRGNTRDRGGDQITKLTQATNKKDAYYIGLVHNDQLAASIYTNTDQSGIYGDWNYTLASTYTEVDGSKSLGLNSIAWVYQKGLDYRIQNEEIAGQTELPLIRVKVVGDANGDGQVNWNDGALAYRAIQPHRFGSEMVPDTVAIRIAMNFGSHAQNPFLTTLDNVKKVYLHTDGLGQNVLLKGYGSEGHDSGHLNYADIGRRIGGAEDMKFLLKEGHKYGARFGIHVNASETYPESKYFEPDRLRRNGSNYSYGWNWIDQGININADYDLKNGRSQRFADLAAALDNGSGKNDLDYIYVDVWGNGQSGDNSSWPTMQLAKEIQRQGWAVAAEWGYAFAPVSIFQHWAADVTYGNFQNKGINSKLIRFVQNSERDSWTANYADHSGTAINPLLGGYNMKDFEGWQGRNGYAAYIYNLFRVDVPSKFVQHFEVMKWDDGSQVALPNANWLPDMRIELKNTGLDKGLVIERGSNDYANDPVAYRSRTMTLDGKVVLREEPDNPAPRDETLVEYLLPWYWDENGQVLPEGDQKLYAFTNKGQVADWDLPASWAGLDKVYCYRLSDLGRTQETEIPVNHGRISLELEEGQPYVLYQTAHPETRDVEWSNGAHITDTGFNSRSLSHWDIKGAKEGLENGVKVAVVDTASGTQVLEISNNKEEVSLSQKLVGLKANTQYAAYVGVENRADAKAYLQIMDGGTPLARNESGKSIALNFIQAYTHNTNNQSFTLEEANPYHPSMRGTSYFQNMYVFFRTGNNTDNLSLQIAREAGDGLTYFDDIRIVENLGNPYSESPEGKLFRQDFEQVAQGVYPFVLSGVEGVQDNRQHLSERHEPYTQRGWHTKLVSDVIDGTWSLKVNGLITRNNMLFQTIPQNYHFVGGKTYRVSFDYLAGTDQAFDFVLGSGPYYGRRAEAVVFRESLAGTRHNSPVEAGHYAFEFTIPQGEEDYWIGIYSNSTPADTRGVNAADLNFSGVKDFVLDNLQILEKNTVAVNKAVLEEIIQKAEELVGQPNFTTYYTQASRLGLLEAIAYGKERLTGSLFTQEAIDAGVDKLYQAMNAMVVYQPDTSVLQDYLKNAERVLADSSYADTDKPELRTVVNEVKDFLNEAFLPVEQITELREKLKASLDKVRASKGEVQYVVAIKKIPADKITATAASSEADYDGNATKDKAVDGKINTFWHNDWQNGAGLPHWIILKLDQSHNLAKLNYIARFGRVAHGRIQRYKIETSQNGQDWDVLMDNQVMPGPVNQLVNPISFVHPVQAQYLRFTILAAASNLGIIGELEFFDQAAEASEVIPLPQALAVADLRAEIALANAEKEDAAYAYSSPEKVKVFEEALIAAKEIMGHLYQPQVDQAKLDQAFEALKKARLGLDGKANLVAKERETKARAGEITKGRFTGQGEKELLAMLAELPRFSRAWMELEKQISAYRLNTESSPYLPAPSGPSQDAPKENTKVIPDSQVPKAGPHKGVTNPFKDVVKDAWYAEAVLNLFHKNIMVGVSPDRFELEGKVSRAMLPVALYRLEKAEDMGQSFANIFQDVAEGTWYEKGIIWARAKGYVRGGGDGNYQPNGFVTRQDFLVILYRYFMDKGQKATGTGGEEFEDYGQVSAYAQEAVHWAKEKEIIQGRPDGKVYPREEISRAEMASILDRALKLLEK